MKVPLAIPRLVYRHGHCRHLCAAANVFQSHSQIKTTATSTHTTSDSSSMGYALTLASVLMLTGAASSTTQMQKRSKAEDVVDAVASEMPSSIPKHDPLRQPRNVMLHRMRSAAGRGLNDKYKVDWNTVLGGTLKCFRWTLSVPPIHSPFVCNSLGNGTYIFCNQ